MKISKSSWHYRLYRYIYNIKYGPSMDTPAPLLPMVKPSDAASPRKCFACRMGLPWPCRCQPWRWLVIVALLTASLALAGCGGGDPGKPKFGGIVTAKIAPKGTIECGGGGLCSNDYNFAVWIEPLPGQQYTGYSGWYQERSLVCIDPSYWRMLHIGSRFDIHHPGNDLNCDG